MIEILVAVQVQRGKVVAAWLPAPEISVLVELIDAAANKSMISYLRYLQVIRRAEKNEITNMNKDTIKIRSVYLP